MRVVGSYEPFGSGRQHNLGEIPERLTPYEGKTSFPGRICPAFATGQSAPLLTFFVWHRPDLSGFVVCRLEEWVNSPRLALGLGSHAFAELIGGLPRWEGDSACGPGSPPRPA